MIRWWRVIMLERVRSDSRRLRVLCVMHITLCSQAASVPAISNLSVTTPTTPSIIKPSTRASCSATTVIQVCRRPHWTIYNSSTRLSHMTLLHIPIRRCHSLHKTFRIARLASSTLQQRPAPGTGRLTLLDNRMWWDHPYWKRRVNLSR